jgi:hypothetical protein
MKRILIMEVEPGKQCPYHDQACLPVRCTLYVVERHNSKLCSDESCDLPKIEGGNKRLLITEVEPNKYTCPCGTPLYRTRDKWQGFYEYCQHCRFHGERECEERECSDENCPLPTLNPDKEGET